MTNWDNLSMLEKYKIIKAAVASGVNNLNSIRYHSDEGVSSSTPQAQTASQDNTPYIVSPKATDSIAGSYAERAALMMGNANTHQQQVQSKANLFADGGGVTPDFEKYGAKRKTWQSISTGGISDFLDRLEEYKFMAENDNKTLPNGYTTDNFGYEGSDVELMEMNREDLQKNAHVPPYIGGKRSSTWQKYWNEYPRLGEVTDSIAGVYGINPLLLRNNLNQEGFIDTMIGLNNARHQQEKFVHNTKYIDDVLKYPLGTNQGFHLFGLDYTGDYINKGLVTPTPETKYNIETDYVNEKGVPTVSTAGYSHLDNISLSAATLKYLSDVVKQDYPNLSEEDHNRYVRAYFNRGIANGRKWVKNGAKGYDHANNKFEDGGEVFNGGFLDGITVTPSGNRDTDFEDWSWANYDEVKRKAKERELAQIEEFTNNIRKATDNVAPYVGAGLVAGPLLAAAPTIAGALPKVGSAIVSGAKAVATPGSAFWMNPTTKAVVSGEIGSRAVDLLSNAATGQSVSGNVGGLMERATGWNPNSTWYGNMLTESFNPGWYTPAGLLSNSIHSVVSNTVPAVKTAAKAAVNAADKTARHFYPSYDIYRTISETTPRNVAPISAFDASSLIDTPFNEVVYTGGPLFEFVQTLKTSPNKSYFMRTPKDIDLLKLGNGRYKHEVVGNNILPSGEVEGKFVSYGEPWKEFALTGNSALYEFPVGPKRGPGLMATDWKGRPQKYSVDEIYDYMQREEALKRGFEKDVVELGLDKLKGTERIKAYRKLEEEKYPELLHHFDTSIYGANQTVIPNDRWNFDKFLKTPFWKYSENPISGQVQKELFIPEYNYRNNINNASSISLGEALPTKITAGNAAEVPIAETFYHGSPYNWDKYNPQSIGWGEGASKGLRGLNLSMAEDLRLSPKMANIKSSDAPIHLGVSSEGPDLPIDPRIYTFEGKGLKLFDAAKAKGLNQEELIAQGYDGVRLQSPRQVTIFPESVEKLQRINKQTIEDFIISHPEVEDWIPFTRSMQKSGINPYKLSTVTDAQWDEAYNAAIKAGDMQEAQRLRDLHFKAKAPDTKIVDENGMPKRLYHGTPNAGWNAYNPEFFGKNDQGLNGVGLYTTGWKTRAGMYAGKNGEVKELYANAQNPFLLNNDLHTNMTSFMFNRPNQEQGLIPDNIWYKMKNADAVSSGSPYYGQVVIPKGEQVKLANADTFDDVGNLIPLSQRDNFNKNDIRYNWLLPLILSGASVPYLNNQQTKNKKKGSK